MRLTLEDRVSTPAKPRFEYYVCAKTPDGRVRRFHFAQNDRLTGTEAIYRAKRKIGLRHIEESWSVEEIDRGC